MLLGSKWARFVVAAIQCGSVITTSPAAAYKWPGEGADHTAVLAAMVIGQSCRGSLSRQERVEIRSYLSTKRHEHEKQQADPKSREANPIQQDQLDGLAQALAVLLMPDEVQKVTAYYARLAAEQQAAKDKTGTYPPISWVTMQRGVAGAFNRTFGRARNCDAATMFARHGQARADGRVGWASARTVGPGTWEAQPVRRSDRRPGDRAEVPWRAVRRGGRRAAVLHRPHARRVCQNRQTCGSRSRENLSCQGGDKIRARLCRLR